MKYAIWSDKKDRPIKQWRQSIRLNKDLSNAAIFDKIGDNLYWNRFNGLYYKSSDDSELNKIVDGIIEIAGEHIVIEYYNKYDDNGSAYIDDEADDKIKQFLINKIRCL